MTSQETKTWKTLAEQAKRHHTMYHPLSTKVKEEMNRLNRILLGTGIQIEVKEDVYCNDNV